MKIIQLLNDTKSDTLVYFELPETLLQKTYAPGKWTVRQLLHHLADAETVLYDRIRRVISEPKTLVWAFDQDLWCKHLDYEHMPLPLSKNIFQSVNGIQNPRKSFQSESF